MIQAPTSDASTTLFQTVFKAKGNSYSLMVKGEITTDLKSNQTSFKLFDSLPSQIEISDHPARFPFITEHSLCTQVAFPLLDKSSIFALLIDDCLFSGASLNQVVSQISKGSIIWLDMPTLKFSGSNKGITPVFRVTNLSTNKNKLTIKAQPLNCDQCPYRPKSIGSNDKCCGGCEDNSKAMTSDAVTENSSRKVSLNELFEPVDIKYQLSTNEIKIDFNTTHGVFTTKLSQYPTGEAPISDSWQRSVIPLALLLSSATLIRSSNKE
ncbi:hypothetical protein [Endozoicomonas euniceicola]|uniref:Uncharacterized protein n=1 Tax=Endozoicomonas euniceicola TaxID=1234143 RepID=A0ABY6GWX4_9GAMM|nr:hypothetical protein [Endozoicomonas euniceicola]UYM16571.1 hypothetical protein NX720_01140 [Endozoicomonas euniceicola]